MGLSKTSTSIGWVLVDGRDVGGDPLDHDVFDVADASVAAPAATARRVRDIAIATGYTVDYVRVTSSEHAGTEMSSLRNALAESGFDEVVSVPLTEATQAWAKGAGRANGHERTGVCILDRDSASLSVIDIRSGTIKSTAATKSRDSASLIDWLNTAFGENGSRPESLYLIGSRSELDALAGPLNEGVSIPVVATHDAQLALARGAVFSDKTHVHVDDPVIEERSGFTFYASKLAVVLVVAAASLFTLSAAASPIRLVEKDSQRAATEAVQPETISAAVAETTAVAPPAQHLPEVQPVEHIPETQQAGVPESPPVAPGPIAPPPPLDPLVGVLSPLFSGLP